MTNDGDDIDDSIESDTVKGEYVYTGPKFLADLQVRIGKWLEEERGW